MTDNDSIKEFHNFLAKTMEFTDTQEALKEKIAKITKPYSMDDLNDIAYELLKYEAQKTDIIAHVTKKNCIVIYESSEDTINIKMNTNAEFILDNMATLMLQIHSKDGVAMPDLINKLYEKITEQSGYKTETRH